jgi:Mg2+ and Co2+ transporter CorA
VFALAHAGADLIREKVVRRGAFVVFFGSRRLLGKAGQSDNGCLRNQHKTVARGRFIMGAVNDDMNTLDAFPVRNARPFLRFVLGDVFLGFLAIAAAALTAVPLLFQVSPQVDALLEAGQWSIIALFAVEYVLGLASARSKRAFILNPWRVVDAATILLPLVTLLPGTSGFLRSSPVLRLIRLARVVALGARASGVMAREKPAAATAQERDAMQVRMLPATNGAPPRAASWEEFVHWAQRPGTEWYSIANVGPHNLDEVAKASGISQEFIAAHLLGTNYPHIEITDRYLALFVWVPQRSAGNQIERNGLLLLASDKSVVTFCRRPVHLMEKVAASGTAELAALAFPARTLCQFLRVVLDFNEALVGGFEEELSQLEDLPVRDSRQQFFERTFRLKKELSAAQSDLWRLRGVLKELAEPRAKLPGTASREIPFLRELAEAADYLYETVNNTREGVLSLIELHLNVVSFEMNRVMRVLAVVSVLGLIPAVVGGLFGMNLSDNPWPFTLPQVTFVVCFAMLTSLYFFVVKGWLR